MLRWLQRLRELLTKTPEKAKKAGQNPRDLLVIFITTLENELDTRPTVVPLPFMIKRLIGSWIGAFEASVAVDDRIIDSDILGSYLAEEFAVEKHVVIIEREHLYTIQSLSRWLTNHAITHPTIVIAHEQVLWHLLVRAGQIGQALPPDKPEDHIDYARLEPGVPLPFWLHIDHHGAARLEPYIP